VLQWFRKTLFGIQSPEKCAEHVGAAIGWLVDHQLLTVGAAAAGGAGGAVSDTALAASPYGIAAHKSGLSLDTIETLCHELCHASKSLIVDTDLHLLFIVSQADLAQQLNFEWQHLYTRVTKLKNQADKRVAEAVGLTEAFLTKCATGKHLKPEDQAGASRFLLALCLKAAVSGKRSVWKIARDFSVDRGFIQGMLQQAAVHAHAVACFCANTPRFWALAQLLKTLPERLALGVPLELVPLARLSGVSTQTARLMYQAGLKAVEDVALIDADLLVGMVERMSRARADAIIFAAQQSLRMDANEILAHVSASQSSSSGGGGGGGGGGSAP